MKLIRKGITAIFAIMFLAALGVMAVGCSGNKITLSFVVNGGPNSIDSMMVEPGSQVTLPDPEWEGHEFEGWYIHPELTGEMYRDKITAPKTNTTYYAKWSDTIQVTLDPAGGTLSETKFSLKAGASLYNELKKYVPQHENRDLQFGAWFLDGQEVTQNTKVSSSVTVVARYKVSYTVQYYLQNYELSAFELDGSRQVSGTEYVGTPVTAPTTQINGFLFDEGQAGNVTQLAQLSEHASENVMSLYYRRGTYVLEYNSNAPEEHAVSGTPYISRSYLFGTKVNVEQNFFTVSGCRFSGWSTTADGDVAYKPEEEMTLNGRTVLYAVWDIGNSDMSGSGDNVFFPRDDQNKAILNRGGYEFVGTRNGDNFTIEHGNKTYNGSVSNGYFALTSSDLQGDYIYIDPYYQYKRSLDQSDNANELIDEKMTLTVESDMSAKFKNEGSTRYPNFKDAEFEGKLVPYAGGYALLMQNGAYPFILNFVENPDLDEAKNESEKYFTIRGFEANQYFEMALSLENFQTYPEYLVTLDGYGKITMYDHQNDKTIPGDYYAIENRSIDDGRGGIIYFSNIIHAKFDGNDFGENQSSEAEFNFVTYMIVNPDGSTLYVFVRQNTDMAGTLKEKNGSDGATGTLTLDGFGVLGEAIYKANGTDVTKKGTYSFTISNHEGLYLAMEIEQEGSSRTTTEWFRVEFNDGETTDETEFIGTFEKVAQGPGEEFLMLLKSEDRDGEEAKVTFGDYSMTIDGSHTTRIYKKEENSKTYSKLAATGRVQTTDSSTNAYHNTWKFTRNSNSNDENDGDDQNVPNEFNFTLYEYMVDDGKGNMRSVFVSSDWDGKSNEKKSDIAIKYTDEGGLGRTLSYIETGTEYAGTTYTDELGRVFNGGLIINGEGQSFFSDEQHKIALLVWYDNVSDTQNPSFKFYTMSLDETKQTFLVVGDEKPLYRITPEGEIDENIVLATRGDSEAVLIDKGGKHLGTLTSEPKSDLGSKVYKVDFDDDTEDLYYSVTTYTSGGYEYECWFAYHQAMDGDFVVGDDETFTTDGYDHATFETGSYSTSGTFYCDETDSRNIVVYYTGSDGKSTFTYMFLFNGSAFVKIDNAYIGHSPLTLLDSEQKNTDYKVSFDGRGTVTIEKDGEKIIGTYIMGTGLYLECNVKFSQDFKSYGREFIIAFLSDVTEDGKIERKCIIKDKDGERSYADDEMNVIYLNGYGTVEYHYANGTYQTGTYKIENNTIKMEFEIDGEKITKTATVDNQSMSFMMTENGENKA